MFSMGEQPICIGLRKNKFESEGGEKRKDVSNHENGKNQQNQGGFKNHKGNGKFQFKGNNGGSRNFNNENKNQCGKGGKKSALQEMLKSTVFT